MTNGEEPIFSLVHSLSTKTLKSLIHVSTAILRLRNDGNLRKNSYRHIISEKTKSEVIARKKIARINADTPWTPRCIPLYAIVKDCCKSRKCHIELCKDVSRLPYILKKQPDEGLSMLQLSTGKQISDYLCVAVINKCRAILERDGLTEINMGSYHVHARSNKNWTEKLGRLYENEREMHYKLHQQVLTKKKNDIKVQKPLYSAPERLSFKQKRKQDFDRGLAIHAEQQKTAELQRRKDLNAKNAARKRYIQEQVDSSLNRRPPPPRPATKPYDHGLGATLRRQAAAITPSRATVARYATDTATSAALSLPGANLIAGAYQYMKS